MPLEIGKVEHQVANRFGVDAAAVVLSCLSATCVSPILDVKNLCLSKHS